MVKMLNRCKRGKYAGLAALTRVEILVIVGVLLLLAVIFIASMTLGEAKSYACQMACESNLKQIGIAFRTWEENYNDMYPMRYFTNADGSAKYADGSNVFRYFQVMSNQLQDPRVVTCPSDVRKPASDFEHLKNQNLSYFVGLQADETWPAMLLSGDRNLVTNRVDVVPGLVTIGTNMQVDWSAKTHNLRGNFVFADGSVEAGSGGTFQMYIGRTGTNVIRLAVP